MERTKKLNVYIDGFNLYFGMKEAGFEHCKWLDVYSLSLLLKKADHELNEVKYFTARVTNDVQKQKRQDDYLEALETRPVRLIFGRYIMEKAECPACFHRYADVKEKMTDVNIATQMIIDAYRDRYDVAMLISGDSDLVPPIKEIRRLFPQKEIIVAFPPERYSFWLRSEANSAFAIGRKKLEACQLPDEVVNKYSFVIRKPAAWP